jgi:arylsulfatase A-like enzyme
MTPARWLPPPRRSGSRPAQQTASSFVADQNPGHPVDERSDTSGAFSTRALLVIGAWAAVWLGVMESGLLMFARFRLGRYTHVNPQNIWMTPLFYAVVALGVTGIILAVWRKPSVVRSRAVLFIPTWFGTVGVLLLLTRLHQLAVLVLAAGISVTFVRFVVSRPHMTLKVVRTTSWAAAVYTIGAFLVLNGSRAVREQLTLSALPAGSGPNVLLIILDTVRAASLSLYDSPRNTTPGLVHEAQRGVLFQNAFSVAPWTLPAHASMFTGRWPNELSADWRSPLDDLPPTLAEVLRARGYRTGGFSANTFYTSRESGLARGFLHYEAYPVWSAGQVASASSISRTLLGRHDFRRFFAIDQEPGRRTAGAILTDFLAWQDQVDDRPFFGFINLFDAHAPYLPPAPFDTLFGPRLPGRDPSMKDGRALSPIELQSEIDAYDGAIAYLDDQIRQLLAELESRGVLQNTLVVITSDHGEEFGEHGVFTHGNSLYREGVHVPLLLLFPQRIPEGHRIEQWVSTRDLPATILDLMGISSPLPGRSLARFWTEEALRPDTLVAAVSHATGRPEMYPVSHGDLYSVMAQPYRYIINDNGCDELYDLSGDPNEQNNMVEDPVLAPVRSSLNDYISRAYVRGRGHRVESEYDLESFSPGMDVALNDRCARGPPH